VLFVTDDGEVVDTVYDEGIEHGTVLKVGEGRMFQQLNTVPTSVPLFQDIMTDISSSADKATSSFDAVLGEESKSGTPFRSQYLQNIAGNSQFEREREDMGMFIGEIIEDWLIDEALKEAAKENVIDDTFTKQELSMIDKALVNEALITAQVGQVRSGTPVTTMQSEEMRLTLQNDLQQKGSRRRIEDIKEFIEKAGDKVLVHTTDEQRSKQVLFESYSNALALFAEDDPARLALRDRILEQMGISQDELALYAQEAATAASALPNADGMKMDALREEEALAPVV
jgi:hypothetical protein